MYRLITEIAQTCHQTATRRGKDTSRAGCMAYMPLELAEYWDAVENGRMRPDIAEIMQRATELSDADFTALYAEKIHNTTTDELADLMIVAAAWYWAAQLDGGDAFDAARSWDVVMLTGAIHFVFDRTNSDPADMEQVRTMVTLKMRYNDLRND